MVHRVPIVDKDFVHEGLDRARALQEVEDFLGPDGAASSAVLVDEANVLEVSRPLTSHPLALRVAHWPPSADSQ